VEKFVLDGLLDEVAKDLLPVFWLDWRIRTLQNCLSRFFFVFFFIIPEYILKRILCELYIFYFLAQQ
jgi:hypothetical protein